MPVDWDAVQKALAPVKDYADLCRRLQASFAYPFVTAAYNFTLPELVDYTQAILGGDSRQRYTAYLGQLLAALAQLEQAGVPDVLHLLTHIGSPERLQEFVEQTGMDATSLVSVLKFLLYWVIPAEKYLSALVRDDPAASQAIMVLAGLGIRSNLQVLQQGLTPSGRQSLAASSGLPAPIIAELVHRADFSRLPWASKATISNIIGAGYASLAQLATAEPEQLYTDFFSYGKSIGKNLKLGNEIDNSYRIARIVPTLVQDD